MITREIIITPERHVVVGIFHIILLTIIYIILNCIWLRLDIVDDFRSLCACMYYFGLFRDILPYYTYFGSIYGHFERHWAILVSSVGHSSNNVAERPRDMAFRRISAHSAICFLGIYLAHQIARLLVGNFVGQATIQSANHAASRTVLRSFGQKIG